MGMFDTVTVKYKLEGEDWSKYSFQTKNLGNSLSWFTISEEGKLYENFRLEDGFIFEGLYEFHGQIEIHSIGKNDEWISFDLIFDRGILSDYRKNKTNGT